MQQHDTTPWYRQFWPWFILAILGWGVFSATTVLVLAVRNPPQLMTGDYARLGKALVDTHVRADRAEALGLIGNLELIDNAWTLRVTSSDPGAPGQQLLLMAQHPTDAARDRQVLLERDPNGAFTGTAEAVPARGRIIVSDPEQTWWISSFYEIEDDELDVRLIPERL